MSELSLDRIRALASDTEILRDIRYVPSVDSTNLVAARLRPDEWTTGTTVLSNFQSAGRGRLGRSWLAPPGTSVMLSVIFRREAAIAAADHVMMAALAVRDAVSASGVSDVRVKWPNDVLVRGRKIAGILAESNVQEGTERTILGIGVNANFERRCAEILPGTATSLDRETGYEVDRNQVAADLIHALDLWYRSLTHRPGEVFDSWAAALGITDVPISIQDVDSTWDGIALGVQRDGGLLVKMSDGRIRCVYAGDVSLRLSKDFTDA